MGGCEHGVLMHTLTWYALFVTCYRGTCSLHAKSVSGHAQSRGDQINIQRVGCLCPLFLALFHCSGDGVGGDLSTWLGEAWNKVQAAFPTLIMRRMNHRGACRVLAHGTHTTWWPAFGESIEMCMWHRSVNFAAGAIVQRCNCINIMRHIALLPDDQKLRWCLSSSFSPLRSPRRGPLIDPVHLKCAIQPEVSHASPIHV